MSSSLFVIPVFVRKDEEVEVVIKTLETLREHESDADALVVDDRSPDREGVERVFGRCKELDVEYLVKDENSGFSKTVNYGIRRAEKHGQNAILANADLEFVMPVARKMEETKDSLGRPAAVVGALLLYPETGLIQHAGVFLSMLNRGFDHRFRFAPGGLPEAHVPTVCPVTGALQFIRHSTIETVGQYDEDYALAYEDMDMCLRVFDADLECVYNPEVRAIHHESLFRGSRSEKLDRWQQESLQTLHEKHGQTSLGAFVPPIA